MKKELIEKKLEELIPESKETQFLAARYALLNGGKRIRPLIAVTTVDALGGDSGRAIPFACALELIHTYSLIHDDLPCMDDDDMRRGKPSLHKAFNEAIAILTGDYLLTYAFEILASGSHLKAEQKLELIHSLSKAAGGHGMIRGQVMDIEYGGKS